MKNLQSVIRNIQETQLHYVSAVARARGNVLELLKYYYIAPDIAKFEIFISLMLDRIIKIGINILKKMNGGK